MRQTLHSIASILLLSLFCTNIFAQTPSTTLKKSTITAAPTRIWQRDTVKNTDPSLNGQYKFMLSRTRTSADGYKMVAGYRLDQLWKNVIDTLRKEKATTKGLQQKLSDHEKTISYLKTEISGKEASLTENNDKINEIRFLGIAFEKGTYNIIVWSVIGVLAIALIIVVVRSGKNIAEAKHRTQLYNEVAEEYQAYKSKSVEKERKLARELQDERNKLDDLNGRR
ncbi:hypothetical protein [Pedobacter sp. SL55]|uniref:hypothetical protein n=1 Tax=Pedobacter sp. SL55 TaxID=2995161 RepID=UPI00226F601D|nr:hypothetical protein [Pedobacter sp. SL55]WAC42622.1 hypothetical protein OVA16_09775 [Pedobacter sp. SL55]